VIRVEARYVDITLESSSTLVLIEDKISAGAKQKVQLLRYYLAAVEQSPLKRILAVYLAPGGMGAGEVDAVERNCVRIDRRTTPSPNCRGKPSPGSSMAYRRANTSGLLAAAWRRSRPPSSAPDGKSTLPSATAGSSAAS
jgi:hypothetical protein